MANYLADPLAMARGPLGVRGPHFKNHYSGGHETPESDIIVWLCLETLLAEFVTFDLYFAVESANHNVKKLGSQTAVEPETHRGFLLGYQNTRVARMSPENLVK